MVFSRELTRTERTAIRVLVTKSCANFDAEFGCLPLDCSCYMLNKRWTGCFCKWFQEAVLPHDPALIASLRGGKQPLRICSVCGAEFPKTGKRVYCSSNCAATARRRRQREYMLKSKGKL